MPASPNVTVADMSVMLQSFGFKHGIPRNADFVFDARCLPNPHWHPELRPCKPARPGGGGFPRRDHRYTAMLQQIGEFLAHWIPCFESEGRKLSDHRRGLPAASIDRCAWSNACSGFSRHRAGRRHQSPELP